jgi:polyisoprenoid-binding protein YceI
MKTQNKSDMKKNSLKGVYFIALSVFLTATVLFITSCNKDNVVEPFTYGYSSGSDMININGVDWSLDKTHSNVGWETFYYGDNALLTGRFNSFGLDMFFDQANPSNTTIDGWVVLSTFNTGEPGRDDYGKCGPSYMGVQWDVDTVPEPDVYTPIASSDTAWYSATSTERYGDGYVAHGTLNFRTIQQPTDLYFTYLGMNDTENSSGVVTTRAGFQGQFDMLANSAFGVNSSSIADLVTVKINMNAKMN